MMGEDTSISSSNVISPCGESTHILQGGTVYKKEEQDSVCTVILDPSSDMTFIPILPVSEEVVMYDGMQGEVKIEVDVCSDGYQEIYTEEYPQQSIPTEPKTQHKASRKGVYFCKMCPKTFTQVVNLVTHERIHTGEKPYKCNICMKPFSQQPNLWKHMRTHTGERPYQCHTCKKCFTQQANLTKHIRIHTGERPYGCQYCGKRFTQQANLTKHVRLHTGERPFHCQYCTKTFVQQSNLERHERTHTGVKPFQCKICLESFAQNAHLAKHVRSVHKNTVKSLFLKVANECEDITSSNDEHNTNMGTINNYEGNTSKKLGIPVLYCTKTGKILKRID
uniref:C2H2-type domain-containing protein n=1 Tax=Graphocephala atropunctata TaxID=36148 RepID=A0A1B6KQ23_9HEMI